MTEPNKLTHHGVPDHQPAAGGIVLDHQDRRRSFRRFQTQHVLSVALAVRPNTDDPFAETDRVIPRPRGGGSSAADSIAAQSTT